MALPKQFGDEPLVIAREARVPVFVAAERYEAGLLAEASRQPGQGFSPDSASQRVSVHLLDDGFQHRQLARDVDILLLSSERSHRSPIACRQSARVTACSGAGGRSCHSGRRAGGCGMGEVAGLEGAGVAAAAVHGGAGHRSARRCLLRNRAAGAVFCGAGARRLAPGGAVRLPGPPSLQGRRSRALGCRGAKGRGGGAADDRERWRAAGSNGCKPSCSNSTQDRSAWHRD